MYMWLAARSAHWKRAQARVSRMLVGFCREGA